MTDREQAILDFTVLQVTNCMNIIDACETIDEAKLALTIYIRKLKENKS